MERWPKVGAWRGGCVCSRDGKGGTERDGQRGKETQGGEGRGTKEEEEGEGATTPRRELVRKTWGGGEAEKAREGGHRDGDQERVRWGQRDQDRE